MYAQPSEDAEVVSQAIYGTSVVVLETRTDWLRVRTEDEYTGWVKADGVTRHPYKLNGRVARVDSLFANIYHEPNVTKRQPVVTVPFETQLALIAEPQDNPRWLEVRLPDDRSGWLQRGDVSFDTHPLSIPQAIELSRRFLGLPYTWVRGCRGMRICRRHGMAC
jgi:hypothetical protein